MVLTWPDYAVLAGSLIVLLAIGVSFTRQQRDTVDFFLARRQVPWWAACLSFLATEVSAVTIISVPATAYSENWEYAQFFVGSSLAKLAVAFLFIPAFYRHNVTTIYEFLLHRFGQASQVTASIFFFITRLAGSGVRLTATAVAVAHLLGWSLLPTIATFVVVSIVYIATGGVKAIVWTNVFQALMFLGAGALTLGYLVTQIDGGLGRDRSGRGRRRAPQRRQLGAGARGERFLAPHPQRPEHRVGGSPERFHRVDGRVRDRPRPDASASWRSRPGGRVSARWR